MKFLPLLILLPLLISCSEKSKKFEFKTEAYSTIKIIQKELLNDSVEVSIRHNSIIPDYSEKVTQQLSGNAQYIYIEIDRPSNASLRISDSSYGIWLSPNDTTTINLSKSGEIESFSGKFKKENQYYLAKKEGLGFLTIIEPFNQDIQRLKSYKNLKNTIDSLSNIELDFLRDYPADLPTDFWEFERNQIIYNSATLKAQFPLFNRAMKVIKEPLPDNYYNFIENIELNNFNAIPTRSYFDFLTNYFWQDVNQDTLKSLGGKDRITYLKNHLLNDANEYLKPEIQDYFLAHHLTNLFNYYDRDKLDSVIIKWEIKANTDLVKKIIAQQLNSSQIYEEGTRIEDFEMMNQNGDIVHIRDFEDKIIYLNFWGTWCKPCIANIPDLNKFIDNYRDNEEILVLNIAIRSKEQSWKESIRKFELKGMNVFIPKGDIQDRVRAKFGAGGVPHYAILDKGNILKVNYANKAPKVKTEIEALLKENN